MARLLFAQNFKWMPRTLGSSTKCKEHFNGPRLLTNLLASLLNKYEHQPAVTWKQEGIIRLLPNMDHMQKKKKRFWITHHIWGTHRILQEMHSIQWNNFISRSLIPVMMPFNGVSTLSLLIMDLSIMLMKCLLWYAGIINCTSPHSFNDTAEEAIIAILRGT